MPVWPLHIRVGWMPPAGQVAVVAIPVAVAAGAYLVAYRRQRPRPGPAVTAAQAACYVAGLFALAFALAGPPEAFAEELFLAHMVQHLLLVLVTPPLVLLGRPVQVAVRGLPPQATARLVRAMMRPRGARRAVTRLGHPVTALAAMNLPLAVWHLPVAYDFALAHESVHVLEHLTFVIGAVLFWRLIIDPVPRHHRASPHAVIGLAFGTCMVGNVVAAAITLSPRLLYAGYRDGGQPALSPLTDQRLGGLVMWLSGAVYFALIFLVLAREGRGGEPAREPSPGGGTGLEPGPGSMHEPVDAG